MALQIDELLEEIKETSQRYNSSHGMLLENTEVGMLLEGFDYELAESENYDMVLEDLTYDLIDEIEQREYELSVLVNGE